MQSNSDNSLKPFLIASVVILLIWAASAVLTYLFVSDWNNRGTFGDMFGAVNALFSGLAFAGVIYTILLQRKELSLQRRELELTREELKKSAEAQQKSEKALNLQAKAMYASAKLNALLAVASNYEQHINAGELSFIPKKSEILKEVEDVLKELKN